MLTWRVYLQTNPSSLKLDKDMHKRERNVLPCTSYITEIPGKISQPDSFHINTYLAEN